jgi:hypothetical protein
MTRKRLEVVMPRSSPSVPSYRFHKPSGRARVTLEGRDIWLGPYGTSESRQKYDRVVAEWLTAFI